MYMPYGVSHRSSSFCNTLASCQTSRDQSGSRVAALVNFIASVTLYTVANLREKRRLKKQRKEEKAAKKG